MVTIRTFFNKQVQNLWKKRFLLIATQLFTHNSTMAKHLIKRHYCSKVNMCTLQYIFDQIFMYPQTSSLILNYMGKWQIKNYLGEPRKTCLHSGKMLVIQLWSVPIEERQQTWVYNASLLRWISTFSWFVEHSWHQFIFLDSKLLPPIIRCGLSTDLYQQHYFKHAIWLQITLLLTLGTVVWLKCVRFIIMRVYACQICII